MDLSRTPLYEIMRELNFLEKDINLKTIKYNLYLEELFRRFPPLKEQTEFYQFKEIEVKDVKNIDNEKTKVL